MHLFELTINKNIHEDTRETVCNLQMSDIEESLMFRTMPPEQPLDDMLHIGNGGTTNTQHRSMPESWSVYPQKLFFDQRYPDKQQLRIQNNFTRPQTFQLGSSERDLFLWSMGSGLLECGQECVIDISLKSHMRVPTHVMLTVYIESDSVDIPVQIIPAPTNY